jgi:hypothetical protein
VTIFRPRNVTKYEFHRAGVRRDYKKLQEPLTEPNYAYHFRTLGELALETGISAQNTYVFTLLTI